MCIRDRIVVSGIVVGVRVVSGRIIVWIVLIVEVLIAATAATVVIVIIVVIRNAQLRHDRVHDIVPQRLRIHRLVLIIIVVLLILLIVAVAIKVVEQLLDIRVRRSEFFLHLRKRRFD